MAWTIALATFAHLFAFAFATQAPADATPGMQSFRAGMQAYERVDDKAAVPLFEKAIRENPNLGAAYVFLAQAYERQWDPLQKGPDTDRVLERAAANYEAALQKLAKATDPDSKKLASIALEHLADVYGPNKLNNPSKAEPLFTTLIAQQPGSPAAYIQLARVLESRKDIDAAEKLLMKARTAAPDPIVDAELLAFYERQHLIESAVRLLETRAAKSPNDLEPIYTIATIYWDEAYRNASLAPADKRLYIRKGLSAVDQALQLKPDYVEALVYKGLLLRLQAMDEPDPAKAQALVKQATELAEKAKQLRNKKP